jgi:hypothetical protein
MGLFLYRHYRPALLELKRNPIVFVVFVVVHLSASPAAGAIKSRRPWSRTPA